MFDRLNIFISIIAGIVYTIFTLVKGERLAIWLPNIIIVLVLFYILGTIFKRYLKKNVIDEFVDDYVDDDEYLEDDSEKLESNKNLFDDLSDD